jgi:hypothetical protein
VRALVALTLLLLLAVACEKPEGVWVTLTAEDGSFRAELPGEPRRVSNRFDTAAGPAPIEMWVREEGERVFMVGYTEYPEKLRTVVSDEELLTSARDGAVERVRGRLLVDQAKQQGGTPGRRIEIDAEDGQARVRGDLFVSGRRLYQVFATVEPTAIESAEVQRFLDSFRLLPRASADEPVSSQ